MLNLSQGIPGNTSGAAISAGDVGEIIKGNAASTNAPAASGAYTNLVVLALTAGQWDVSGGAVLSLGTISGLTSQYVAISTTSVSADTTTCEAFTQLPTSATTFMQTPVRRIILSSSANVYLVAGANYSSAGTANYGTSCFARAVRIA